MNNNLIKFIAIEKLTKAINYGRITLDLQLRDGSIIGITTKGNKRTLYNASVKDDKDNTTAKNHIVARINDQIEKNLPKSTITFKVYSEHDKIKSIEVESEQTI